MISCFHDHFLDDQLLPTPHLYFLYFVMVHYSDSLLCFEPGVDV